jgi:hypothetical protein
MKPLTPSQFGSFQNQWASGSENERLEVAAIRGSGNRLKTESLVELLMGEGPDLRSLLKE